jgi:hypothetical protein
MRFPKLMTASMLVVAMMMSTMIVAESKNPADYPLRLHIFGRSQTTFYHWRSEDEAKGDGRANLFENSEAHGVDFNYDCGEKVRASFGFQTYPARWKKPGRELVVLLPVFGESGKFFTCDFKTDVKDFAYAMGRNGLNSEPVAQYKLWMQRHDYDPEHGKDVPVRNTAGGDQGPVPAPQGAGEAASPSSPPPPPPTGAPQR